MKAAAALAMFGLILAASPTQAETPFSAPVADAVLSYSQSTDPASPYYADQTLLYSQKGWHRLPFHPADIAADGAGPPLVLKGN